jgi:exopolyphosphatase/pppGpp-phosphohydrolase
VRRAVLDLGSNSLQLSIADVGAGGELSRVVSAERHLRLGAEAGEIPPEAWTRTLRAVDELVACGRASHAAIATFGTITLGEPGNGAALAAAVGARTGGTVERLSGERKVRLTWAGARRAVASFERPVALVDVGGGEIGVAGGARGECHHADSVPIGFLRARDPERIRAGLRPPIDAVRALEPAVVVLCGGTARVLARLAGSRRLTRATVTALAARLGELHRASRIELGVPADRADTIRTGSRLVAIAMELLGVDDALVSGRGFCEGALGASAR